LSFACWTVTIGVRFANQSIWSKEMVDKTGIELAVESAGGQAALARHLGLTKAYIHKMLRSGVVPAVQCQHIHGLTGVPLILLNPAIYKKTKGN
jgi:hypothetical protein